ncbi:hypothetical protein [uncultured Bradyrhizobium sp.]|uniref:hypothetical protein n=1 Tax=uncultured Bradyrhizobium sp. TaxID=199684 RepID=UPI0035CC0600
MSYLNPTRVHFAGLFRADVSTVNNDDQHFDSATFTPNDQDYGDNTNNGWWQPSGTGAWRLCGCTITGAAWDGKFATTGAADPVVGLPLRNSSDRVDAKIVDLDPDQQMVSMIFGLEVRIADPASGTILMSGRFSPAPFMGMWGRGGAGDTGASVFYHSSLTDVAWGDLSKSPALQALQAATIQGQLSMRFMLDSYNMSGDKRGYGRIVGTIGPALAGEPVHFVAGRHLASIARSLGNVTCCIDPAGTHILADFGNALPSDAHGNVPNLGSIHLVAVKNVAAIENGAAHLAAADIVDLGSLAGYSADGYYLQTAAIQAFPDNGSLTAPQLQALRTLPLAVVQSDSGGGWNVWAAEAPDGIYARADMFVCRINPGESQTLPIKVTRFGQPLAGQTVVAVIGDNTNIIGGTFPLCTPATALQLDVSGPTDGDGWTKLTITGSDPGRPRQYLDGQIYEIDLTVKNAASAGTAFDPWLFISVLLFSETAVPDTVTWNGDVLPILQQYANLYPRPHGPVVNYDPEYPDEPNPAPLLHPVISLTNKDWVASFAPRILTALGLPIEHPNHMPVTRDLSAGRRGILQKWMQQVIVGSVPLEPGPVIPPGGALEARRAAPRAAPRQQPEMPDSKTAAMRRMKSGMAHQRGTK